MLDELRLLRVDYPGPWRLLDVFRTLQETPASTQMEQRQALTSKSNEVTLPLISVSEDLNEGIFDKPLPCCGCGIGWFSFLLGFVFPLMWYYSTILYFGNYYRKDPRERAGLAASAIAVGRFA